MEWTPATVESAGARPGVRRPPRASSRGPRRGRRPGATSAAVWGLCKGSGSHAVPGRRSTSPGPAYKCSCPSRKVPCKHALALLLLRGGRGVPRGRAAGVGGEWLRARDRRARRGRPASRRATPRRRRAARPSARSASRRASRICGCGCATPSAAGSAPARLRAWDEWDGFAARMVDAQAPGAASRLRSLGSVAAGRPDGWPERLLSGLGLLHLLCEAHARADGPLRDDVRTLLGWNVVARGRARRRARARPLDRARAAS